MNFFTLCFDKDALSSVPKSWQKVCQRLQAPQPVGLCSRLMMLKNGQKRKRKSFSCVSRLLPEDLRGMAVAQGILTMRGGMTSHAAVVARGMGKCCVSGAGEIVVDYKAKDCRNERQGL